MGRVRRSGAIIARCVLRLEYNYNIKGTSYTGDLWKTHRVDTVPSKGSWDEKKRV